MANKEKLEKETGIFFDRHWGGTEKPSWNFTWNWCGSIPNHDLSGVYALFSGDRLIYIGSDHGHNHGANNKKHGIGKKLLAHVLEIAPADSDINFIPEERWLDAAVDLVATIGFPHETAYLACALENYLIEKLDPPGNHVKPQKFSGEARRSV
ncbi:MAG: hypothetical protein P4L87_14040 [Formivibrio sp.]|nr:hypothetical protein [Formivibrio sp.]